MVLENSKLKSVSELLTFIHNPDFYLKLDLKQI